MMKQSLFGRGLLALSLAVTAGAALAAVPEAVYTWDGSGATAVGSIHGLSAFSGKSIVIKAEEKQFSVPAKSFTVSMWAKNHTHSWRDLFGFADSTHYIQFQKTDGARLAVYAEESEPKCTVPEGSFAFSSSAYQHLTIVQNGGSLKAYVDGVLQHTFAVTGWDNLSAETVTMPYFALGGAVKRDGTIDSSRVPSSTPSFADVKFFDTALTDDQVAELAQVPTFTVQSGLNTVTVPPEAFAAQRLVLDVTNDTLPDDATWKLSYTNAAYGDPVAIEHPRVSFDAAKKQVTLSFGLEDCVDVFAVKFKTTLTATEASAIGFVSGDKGAVVPLEKWYSKTEDRWDSPVEIIGVSGGKCKLTWGSNGGWRSGSSNSSALVERLLANYLDASNVSGGLQCQVAFTELNPAKAYDVALMMNGDSDKFGRITVNKGEDGSRTYSYVDGKLASSSDTNFGPAWGTHDNGKQVLKEGTNVMYIPNLTGMDHIKLNGYNNNGRSRFSAVMLFERPAALYALTVPVTGSMDTWSKVLAANPTLAKAGTSVTLDFTGNPAGTAFVFDAPLTCANLTVKGSDAVVLKTAGTGSLAVSDRTELQTDAGLVMDADLGNLVIADGKTLSVGGDLRFVTLTKGASSKMVYGVAGELSAANVQAVWNAYGRHTAGTYDFVGPVKFGADGTGEMHLAFGVQQLNISDNMKMSRWVTSDANGAKSTIIQNGGTISVTGSKTGGGDTGANAVLFGHWGLTQANTAYSLNKGVLNVRNGSLVMGWDGKVTLTVGQAIDEAHPQASACLSAKRLDSRHNAEVTSVLTVNPSGTVMIGDLGLTMTGANKKVVLNGGELNMAADAVGDKMRADGGFEIAADSVLRVADGATVAPNKLTGTAKLTADGGTVNLAAANLSAFTGSFAVSRGTLVLPAGREAGMEVPEGAALVLQLSDAQMLSGYQLNVAAGSVSRVSYRKPNGEPVTEGVDENGNFNAAVNTLTVDGAAATWDDAAGWSTGAVPAAGEPVVIKVTVPEATLTLGADVSVACMKIEGTGKLVIDEANKLTVTGLLDVAADTVLNKEQLAAGAVHVADGKVLTLKTVTAKDDPDAITAASAVALPRDTSGAGRIIKEGTGDLAVFSVAEALPAIEVSGGELIFREAVGSPLNVTVRKGASLRLAAWQCAFENDRNALMLEGGSKTVFCNGNTVKAAVTVTQADEVSAKIYGATFSDMELRGSVSGTGVLEFAEGEGFGKNGSKYPCDRTLNVTASIAGDLKVKLADAAGTKLSGDNTYTGGTEIAAGGTVIVGHAHAFAAGPITGTGTLVLKDVRPENAGSLKDAGWTGTVKVLGTAGGDGVELGAYANAKSTLYLDNVTAYFDNADIGVLELGPNGFRNNNGFSGEGSDLRTVNIGVLKGTGVLMGPAAGKGAFKTFFKVANATQFAGSLELKGDPAAQTCVAVGNGTYAPGQIVIGPLPFDARTVQLAEGKTWEAVNGVVMNGGTLQAKGGQIVGDLTLPNSMDSVTFDLSVKPLTVTGAVKFHQDEFAFLVLPVPQAGQAEAIPLLNCTNAAELLAGGYLRLAVAEELPVGWFLKAAPEGVTLAPVDVGALPLPEQAEGVTDTTAYTPAAATKLINEVGEVPVTVIAETNGKPMSAEQASQAIELFDGIISVSGESGSKTATVSYNFGITKVTANADGSFAFVAAVKNNGPRSATFAMHRDALHVKLLADGQLLMSKDTYGGNSVCFDKINAADVKGKAVTVKVSTER